MSTPFELGYLDEVNRHENVWYTKHLCGLCEYLHVCEGLAENERLGP